MADAQRAISSPEFTDWMAYAEIEPFGQVQQSWQLAVIAATIANANRDPKKRSQPFQPADFMPEEPLTDAERAARIVAKVEASMTSLGGRRARPGEREARAKARAAYNASLKAGKAGASGIGETGPYTPRRGGRRIAESRPRHGRT